MTNPATLYLVPTPIGHWDDITLRALQTLRECPIIAAEDTRNAKALMSHHGIDFTAKQVFRHDMRNEHQSAGGLVKLLQAGQNVAYVSDNGTPTVSDPGFILARACIAADVPVVPLPGPSALTTALSGCGLGASRFVFLGFPPRKAGEQAKLFARFEKAPEALVLYEAPMRVQSTLEALYTALGDRKVCVARELSKLYETFHRSSLQTLVETPEVFRGEIVVIVGGK